MNILFCGDVVGKAGRECIQKHLPSIIKNHDIDFTIINGENATHGFGLSKEHAIDILTAGADCITLGNHAFDRKSIEEFINESNKIIRPYNYNLQDIQGNIGIYKVKDNFKIMVVNLLGLVFMKHKIDVLDPFIAIENLLKEYKLKNNIDSIIIDFHAETTSEKNAMGFFLDGKVSAILGTHTHIPTKDSRVLPKGTGYRTDVGMCGDYNSVIGMTIDSSLPIFVKSTSKKRLEPAENKASLSASILIIDNETGLCNNIEDILLDF